jgi:hypothetical protein
MYEVFKKLWYSTLPENRRQQPGETRDAWVMRLCEYTEARKKYGKFCEERGWTEEE